eukprot:TRINITY_DN2081_c0_g1_i2.p1 TRINITY_DN2081_c0_g1~~TRINITY_DN2081_c0_g1_i2.p1  ORF type:complete len:711 (+),score=114.33 TRINITY_DN2081_c0_g1_i2:92-2224(+)
MAGEASKVDHTLDSEISASISSSLVLPANLAGLVKNVVDKDSGTDLLADLNTLRIEAKGNDRVKAYIGEQIGTRLVHLAAGESLEVALGAAKLLRSITVYRKNKLILQSEISSILKLVQNANRELQIPLAAVIWNLSSLRPNRDILMQQGVLRVLPTLLKIDGEVQNEAAGATRNLTLDERYLSDFADTEIIDTLIDIMPRANSTTLMTCVLVALRNLSSSDKNQEKMATPTGIANMLEILRRASLNPSKDQKYVLETLAQMSKNVKIRGSLADSKIQELLIPLVNSQNEFLSAPSKEILSNIKAALAEKSEISNALNINKIMHEESDVYVAGLLEKLNIDDQIKAKDIVLKKVVGEGAFGSVYLAEYHGYPVACKVIKTGLNKSNAAKVLDELKLMRRLKHPNVVLLMGACLNEENQIMIVTEFASRGDLKHCLPNIESLAQRIRMLHDVIVGLHWLQAYNIVHRDLKLDNLLVAEDYTVKITDFGLSIENDGQGYSRFGGNIKYSAPEILRERFINKNHNYAYGERTDVYSFGLIWWQVLTRKNPFMDRPTKYPGKEGLVKYILEGYRPTLPKHWPESLKTMITSCWADQQNKRPTFRQILDKWDKLTLDLMCPDPLARIVCTTLWKDQKQKRSFEEVRKAFMETCMASPKLKEVQSQQLANLLCESNFDDSVSFSRFCYAMGWFGPLDKSSNCVGFFNRMKDLLSQK